MRQQQQQSEQQLVQMKHDHEQTIQRMQLGLEARGAKQNEEPGRPQQQLHDKQQAIDKQKQMLSDTMNRHLMVPLAHSIDLLDEFMLSPSSRGRSACCSVIACITIFSLQCYQFPSQLLIRNFC